MKKLLKILVLFVFDLTTMTCLGQTKDTSKMDVLMVYGDSFMFSVKEPSGWTGDTKIAAKYYSNIVFYKSKSDFKNGGALIQVLNFNKQDEQTENDLIYDINSYKKDYKNLLEQELIVEHKDYKCFSKLIYVADNFYQYIVYINPGQKFKSGITVSMNISKRPATEDELKAFREIISSLIMTKG
jgi:hypothetical protein